MKYLIGAVFGAVLAVLPGIPAFTTWISTAPEKPFLFDLYCYEGERRGDPPACPGGRTALVAGVGALVGVAGAAVRRRFELQDSAAPQDQATTGRRPPGALTGDKDRDDVIFEAAVEIVAAVAKKHADGARDPTIRRKDAWRHVNSGLISRAVELRISSPAGSAVDHALEMGWLTSRGSGPEASLALGRTAPPEAAGTGTGAATSDQATSAPERTGRGPQPSSATADETKRAPGVFDEFENLIRLHERGTITDAELAAARARLLGNDS